MILLIDNYDSFTYNIVQYVGELGVTVNVKRNDEISVDDIKQLNPNKIIISPGPCTPNEAGISIDLITEFKETLPILGICLGHQCIGQAFGGKIVQAKKIMHGKTSTITHFGDVLFEGIKKKFIATRYHSLVIEDETFPECLEVTAESNEDNIREIMALKHKKLPIFGLQFHPESILTTDGKTILRNFISI